MYTCFKIREAVIFVLDQTNRGKPPYCLPFSFSFYCLILIYLHILKFLDETVFIGFNPRSYSSHLCSRPRACNRACRGRDVNTFLAKIWGVYVHITYLYSLNFIIFKRGLNIYGTLRAPFQLNPVYELVPAFRFKR